MRPSSSCNSHISTYLVWHAHIPTFIHEHDRGDSRKCCVWLPRIPITNIMTQVFALISKRAICHDTSFSASKQIEKERKRIRCGHSCFGWIMKEKNVFYLQVSGCFEWKHFMLELAACVCVWAPLPLQSSWKLEIFKSFICLSHCLFIGLSKWFPNLISAPRLNKSVAHTQFGFDWWVWLVSIDHHYLNATVCVCVHAIQDACNYTALFKSRSAVSPQSQHTHLYEIGFVKRVQFFPTKPLSSRHKFGLEWTQQMVAKVRF